MAEINFNIKTEPIDLIEKPLESRIKIEPNITEEKSLISSCEICDTPIDPRWGNNHNKIIKRESLNPECSSNEKENEAIVKREGTPHFIMEDDKNCNNPAIPQTPAINENKNSYQQRNYNPRHSNNYNSSSRNFKRYRHYQQFYPFPSNRSHKKFNYRYQLQKNTAVAKRDNSLSSQRINGTRLIHPVEDNKEVPSSPSIFSNCASSSEFSSAAATPPHISLEKAIDPPLSTTHKLNQSAESLMLNFPNGNQVKFLILDQAHENLSEKTSEKKDSPETLASSLSMQEVVSQCNNNNKVSNISEKETFSSEASVFPSTSLHESIIQCNNSDSEVSKTGDGTSSESLISPSTSLQNASPHCNNISAEKNLLHDISHTSPNSNENGEKCDVMVDLEIISENISDIKVVKEIPSSGEIECVVNKCKERHCCAKCYLDRKKLKKDGDVICLGKVQKLPSKGDVQVINLSDR